MDLVLLAFIVSLFLTYQSLILPKSVVKLFSISLIVEELYVMVESSAYMNNLHSRARHNGRSLVQIIDNSGPKIDPSCSIFQVYPG